MVFQLTEVERFIMSQKYINIFIFTLSFVSFACCSEASTNKINQGSAVSPAMTFEDLMNEIETAVGNTASVDKVLISVKDKLARHIMKCSYFPSEFNNLQDFCVSIKINVADDGTVKHAEIMDKERMSKDTAYQIAAENLRISIVGPHCNPLPIPNDKRGMFKEFVLKFDPKETF